MWILSSEEFLRACVTNKNGKNKGKHIIWFNGNKINKDTGLKEEYCKKQFEKYVAKDISLFVEENTEAEIIDEEREIR